MKVKAIVAALALLASAFAVVLASSVELNLYGRVARLENTPENAGRSCHVKGIVSHVSAIRPGVIVLAKMEIPYRGGIPIHLPDGVQMPESGDEIWVEGVTAPIAGRMGSAQAVIMKPSTNIIRCCSAARNMAPMAAIISKPPK